MARVQRRSYRSPSTPKSSQQTHPYRTSQAENKSLASTSSSSFTSTSSTRPSRKKIQVNSIMCLEGFKSVIVTSSTLPRFLMLAVILLLGYRIQQDSIGSGLSPSELGLWSDMQMTSSSYMVSDNGGSSYQISTSGMCRCLYDMWTTQSGDGWMPITSGSTCPRDDIDFRKYASTEGKGEFKSLIMSKYDNDASNTGIEPPSVKHIWDSHIKKELLELTISTAEDFVQSKTPEIRRDFTRLMKLHTSARMKRSLFHPMSESDALKIQNIIEKRLRDPNRYRPLHIMAMGGSVAHGTPNGAQHPWENATKYPPRMGMNLKAPWPFRLEEAFNQVLFNGRDVVRVVNMAQPATSSDVASLAVEYGMWPEGTPVEGPDVIIMSFGTNDARGFANPNAAIDAAEQLILAARKHRCEGGPVLVFHDDPYFVTDHGMRYHVTISQLTRWHDIMGMSSQKAFNDMVYTDPDIDPRNHPATPWWFSANAREFHPGLIYHFSAPWLMIYNFMDALLDSCEYTEDDMLAPMSNLSLQAIPMLKRNRDNGELQRQWRNNEAYNDFYCNHLEQKFRGVKSSCSYGWIANKMGGIYNKENVKKKLSETMIVNKGWAAEGNPMTTLKPGWIANETNAQFVLDVRSSEDFDIEFVTIVYLKSYGEKWENSRIRVRLEVMPKNDPTVIDSTGDFFLEGFHNITSSVNYKQRIRLNTPARAKGQKVRAWFTLESGSTFKINGMFFCAQ